MKRIAPVLLILLFFMAMSEAASACNRCGLFGRRCRFVSHHVPVTKHVAHGHAYQKVVPTTTINIANIYPQGNTVYGSVAAAAPLYATNPALAITASQRAIDGGTAALTAAIGVAHATNQQIAELGKIQALTAHLKAGMQGNQAQSSTTLKITQSGGKMQIEQVAGDGGTTQTQVPSAPVQPAVGGGTSFLQAKCASCHGKDKAQPAGGVYIDGATKISGDMGMRIAEILAGKNVPDKMKGTVSNLSPQDKNGLISEVIRLWGKE